MPGDEPLTSFAENPTKSVERDALVEAQFTRPDEVQQTRVENRWLPCKPNKCTNMQARILMILVIAMLLAILLVVVFIIFSGSSTESAPKEVLVYTLPTDQSEHLDETSTAHAKMIMPSILVNKAKSHSVPEFFDSSNQRIGAVESSVVETADQISEEVFEEVEDRVSTETTPELITTTPTTTSTAAPTTTTLPDDLQFHQTMGGEKLESCMKRFAMGSPSGVYPITAEKSFDVFCDMEASTGGWTVIQRRTDREGSFHKRTMKEYISGFGDLRGNHWLGLSKISQLAPLAYASATLRIEIEGDTCDETCSRRFPETWVGEWNVHVGDAKDGFKLMVQESHAGNLTFNGLDPFVDSNGARFSTVDQDQDDNDFINCAQFRMLGPWWHGEKCSDVALNGYYQTTAEKYDTADKNQNAKRYFVWAFEKQLLNGSPFNIHVKKSVMLLKPSF